MARQRALNGQASGDSVPIALPQPPAPAAQPSESGSAARENPAASKTGGAAPDFGGLERQLRQITQRIEALRPASDLETAIKGLRTDLTEIGRSLTEALPRRAVESLEIEIKALAQRIDHSRESGVDSAALTGLERGLADVREALRGLTTAENLVGVDAAVKELTKKVDVIAAKEDPAALQQLETAIGALRGVVSHVASNDTLTKVAEEVRALSSKVDGVANNAASGHALSALESRIDTLATALNASTEAGHAVPRELEKLLAGLIEKLEWVQLTHTDHAALAHLEDRIAMLVKRLDASDARLGQLDGIERGLADLLVHIEQVRGGATSKGATGLAVNPPRDDRARSCGNQTNRAPHPGFARSLSGYRRACRRSSRHDRKRHARRQGEGHTRRAAGFSSAENARSVASSGCRPIRAGAKLGDRACCRFAESHASRTGGASSCYGAAADRSEFAPRSSARTRLRIPLALRARGRTCPGSAGRDQRCEFQTSGHPRSRRQA